MQGLSVISNDVAKGNLTARRIVNPPIRRTLIIAETARRPKTAAVAAVVQCLRREVARLVEAGLWTEADELNVNDNCDSIIADSSV